MANPLKSNKEMIYECVIYMMMLVLINVGIYHHISIALHSMLANSTVLGGFLPDVLATVLCLADLMIFVIFRVKEDMVVFILWVNAALVGMVIWGVGIYKYVYEILLYPSKTLNPLDLVTVILTLSLAGVIFLSRLYLGITVGYDLTEIDYKGLKRVIIKRHSQGLSWDTKGELILIAVTDLLFTGFLYISLQNLLADSQQLYKIAGVVLVLIVAGFQLFSLVIGKYAKSRKWFTVLCVVSVIETACVAWGLFSIYGNPINSPTLNTIVAICGSGGFLVIRVWLLADVAKALEKYTKKQIERLFFEKLSKLKSPEGFSFWPVSIIDMPVGLPVKGFFVAPPPATKGIEVEFYFENPGGLSDDLVVEIVDGKLTILDRKTHLAYRSRL